jgi:hypothetical protein
VGCETVELAVAIESAEPANGPADGDPDVPPSASTAGSPDGLEATSSEAAGR